MENNKMENNEIEINGVTYIRLDSVKYLAPPTVDGMRYCIVRCRDAGVHAGFVSKHNGREVTLLKTRRLWRWHGKTLSGLATEGTTDAKQCKYADEIDEITVLDACEIIPCSSVGQKSIREEVGRWTNI
jgi:hypothetical protein